MIIFGDRPKSAISNPGRQPAGISFASFILRGALSANGTD